MHFRFVDDVMFAHSGHEYARCGKGDDSPRGSTQPSAESDVYDCFVIYPLSSALMLVKMQHTPFVAETFLFFAIELFY